MAEDPSQVPEGGYLIVLQSNKTCAKASKPVCPPNLQKPSALEIPDHDWQTFTEKMKAACEKTWHPWKLPLLLFLAFVLGGIFLALVLMLGVGANPCPSYRRFSCAQDSSLYVAFVPGGVLILIGFCSYCILPLYLNGKNREHDMEILAACEELTSKCEGKYKVRYLAKNLDQVMAEAQAHA